MTPSNPCIQAALVAALLVSASGAAAQEATVSDRFAVERLRLSPARDGIIGVEAGTVPPPLAWEASGWLGYARDPLVVVRRSDGHQLGTLVQDRVGGALAAEVGLFERTAIALELPFVLSQGHEPGPLSGSVQSLRAGGLGAVEVAPRVAVLRGGGVPDVALRLGVRLPTGTGDSYISSPGVEVEPTAAASVAIGRWRIAADAGAAFREKRHVLDVEVGNELLAQAGVARKLDGRTGLPSELQASLSGWASMGRPLARMVESAFEVRGAAAWDLPRAARLTGGVGVGLSRGWGVPTWRVFLAGQLGTERPVAAPEAPPPAEPPPTPAPPSVAPATPEPEPAPTLEEAAPAEPATGERTAQQDEPAALPTQAPAAEGPVTLAGDQVRFEGAITFDTDKDAIQADSFELLDRIAEFLAAHPELGRIRVEGHTDASGGRAHNLDLSRRRARAVVRALAARGVDEARLTGEGLGPDRPVAENQSAEGRARNRRVEFHVQPSADAPPPPQR